MKKSMRVLLIILVSMLVIIIAGKIYMVKNLENSMIETIPDKESSLDSLPFRNLSINLPNRELFASYLEVDENSTAIFICMGNGEALYEWKPIQVMLFEKGFTSFVFTYSGFGNSTGKPTINNLNKDVLAAYQKFVDLTPYTNERIALSSSLGGGPMINMAKKFDPAPSKFIIYATFSSVRDVLVEMEMFSSGTVWLFPDVWNSKKSIRKIDAPIYLVHSKVDSTIQISNSQRLLEATDSKAQFIILDDFDHNELYKNDYKDLWEIILKNISN